MLGLDVFIVFASITAYAAASTTCYCKDSNKLFSGCGGAVPCGSPNANGFVQCCAQGDICGADGFCHFTHPQVGTSSYYLGSCTDPTFSDESCPQLCSDDPTQDAIYNSQTGLWSCCWNSAGKLDCAAPGQETFEAPPPEVLFSAPFASLTAVKPTSSNVSPPSSTSISIAPAPTTSSSNIPSRNTGTTLATTSSPSSSQTPSSSSSSSSSHGTTTSATSSSTGLAAVLSSSSTTTSQQAAPAASTSQSISAAGSVQTTAASSTPSSDLSSGAKAGIGIGVIVSVAALAAAAFFFFWRSRRNKRQNNQNATWHETNRGMPAYAANMKSQYHAPAEMATTHSMYAPNGMHAELPSPPVPTKDWKTPFRSELPADSSF